MCAILNNCTLISDKCDTKKKNKTRHGRPLD